MMNMVLRLNLCVLHRDCEQMYHEHGFKIDHLFLHKDLIRFTMNSMMNMVLSLNISVLQIDCDQMYHEQPDEHGVKIEHQCFT